MRYLLISHQWKATQYYHSLMATALLSLFVCMMTFRNTTVYLSINIVNDAVVVVKEWLLHWVNGWTETISTCNLYHIACWFNRTSNKLCWLLGLHLWLSCCPIFIFSFVIKLSHIIGKCQQYTYGQMSIKNI